MKDKVKDVVSSFIVKENRVLLLKRSDEIGTFPAHWSGISGYREGNPPLQQAYTEIEEETRIKRKQLKLLERGEVFTVDEEAPEGVSFRIFPFKFTPVTDSELTIKLNWENSSFRWVVPEKIRELRTVPKLLEVWRSVNNE